MPGIKVRRDDIKSLWLGFRLWRPGGVQEISGFHLCRLGWTFWISGFPSCHLDTKSISLGRCLKAYGQIPVKMDVLLNLEC